MTQARNLGAMRHLVEIQTPVRKDDGGGGFETTYDTVVENVLADVQPVGAKEMYQAQRLNLQVTHTMQIRFRGDVKQGGRAIWRGITMYIERVLDRDDRQRFLTLWVREGGAL
jgi:SPP1 family predicted phage head-tail adaptor